MVKNCTVAWGIRLRKQLERNGNNLIWGALSTDPRGLALKSHLDGPKERPCIEHDPSGLAPAPVLGSLPSVAPSPGQVIER
jgi:hypothetical protein